MSVDGSIVSQLPVYVPTSVTTFTEELEIETTSDGETIQTTYTLPKSPYEQLRTVTAVVNGVEQELSIGSDVVPSDVDGDQYHTLTFEAVTPDLGTIARVEYDAVPIIQRYVGTFDQDVEHVGESLSDVIDSRGIEHVSGLRLDLLGSLFGEIGSRRGRTDDEYRSYLLSIARAFNATGTKSDLKFVASAAAATDESNITVTEDTDEVGFNIEINTDESIFARSFTFLLNETSAVGVELLGPPVIVLDTATISINTVQSSVTSRESGLGSGSLGSGTLD